MTAAPTARTRVWLLLAVALTVVAAGFGLSETAVAAAESAGPETVAAVEDIAAGQGRETGRSSYDLVSGCCVATRGGGGVGGHADHVLLDSNVTTGLKADPKLGGRIQPGENPVVSYVSRPELRNAAASPTSRLSGVPGALDDLPTLTTRPSLHTRINIRGQLPNQPGRFGDGIIGAQALEGGLPLVTNDKALRAVIEAMGGVVR